MRLALICLVLWLAGCTVTTTTAPQPPTAASGAPGRLAPGLAARNFVSVVQRVEPVAERVCREQTRGANCDFLIVIDDRRGRPPNAFQTLDRSGRPVVGFNLALIADARNQDELAFILGHESAHHIAGHIARGRQAAAAGAIFAGAVAQASGLDPESVRSAQEFGGQIGVRSYAKGFELEADYLGARIASRAGYDAVRGAAYFTRIPDPGNRFLGTHPPNADRIAVVRRAVGR
jgi:predicted Zn-dependent protease